MDLVDAEPESRSARRTFKRSLDGRSVSMGIELEQVVPVLRPCA